jgi:hypothetical protein
MTTQHVHEKLWKRHLLAFILMRELSFDRNVGKMTALQALIFKLDRVSRYCRTVHYLYLEAVSNILLNKA